MGMLPLLAAVALALGLLSVRLLGPGVRLLGPGARPRCPFCGSRLGRHAQACPWARRERR
jgi:hypothetical protein